jgi:hypothetical protein
MLYRLSLSLSPPPPPSLSSDNFESVYEYHFFKLENVRYMIAFQNSDQVTCFLTHFT